MADLRVFQVLLQHPPLARRLYDLLEQLLLRNSLDARLRELVIMRIAWRTGSVYEWTQHWPIARGVGIDEPDVLAVRDWRAHTGFGPADRAVLAASDEVIDRGAISSATWAECASAVGDTEALIELVSAIGAWQMISVVLRSLAIDLEDGAAPWPPDGTRPPDVT
ncbi:MAG: carboxymuconolactone decarboxylase family protein [Actinobacteria bacterium]|nr:MAG: carboxymuconolactone decarboxylase family protein [Actinomycetota bacterium]RIK04426.1 MAG: carboxymuconolactone decarboxylase family protein [Acidobacteriota bacterium]